MTNITQPLRNIWHGLIQSEFSLITTSYVFDEIVTYLNSHRNHEKAVLIGKKLLLSPSVEIHHVDEDLFYDGWDFFQKYKDKAYSLPDCISFIVMKRKG